jgi:LPS-assembly lipoprotein
MREALISPPSLARRAFLLLGGGAILQGCGFSPMYATASDSGTNPEMADLAAITVGAIPDRSGQELREALQERFQLGGVGIARRYDLDVIYAFSEQGIGIQPDTSVTYQRVIGIANWTLRSQDPHHTTLTTGKARAVDGFNFIDEQFFDSTLEDEKVHARIAIQIADQITLQLASYFKRHPAKPDGVS